MFILYIFILLLVMALVSFIAKKKAYAIAAVDSIIILILTILYAFVRFYGYTGGMVSTFSYPIDTSIGFSFSS